ncbi:hypothetical protein FNO01nite_19240 [Flavobacterium noncentrifugens]|nr:ATP-binding protein [Flavobacterium noncentrifugens]GEP51252.1 hypothetical protein FNO01nite_19240 [Flavobacterium noncentrifugens]
MSSETENEKAYIRKLETELEQLRKQSKELDSFSSIASHDLKEPLRKIMLFSKLVIDAEKEKVSETSARYLERIAVSADRLQHLIDDLIAYSRTGTEKIKFTKTNLNQIVAAAKSELKESIKAKNVEITADELPTIHALKSQMTQLFTNLLSNSIKYSKADEISQIHISCEKATADSLSKLNTQPEMTYYKIAISDNGIGFPNEFSEVIFEPFKRLHGKDDYAGTGIGLAICKKIVENHNGFIAAESEPGKGTVFSVFLPDQETKN